MIEWGMEFLKNNLVIPIAFKQTKYNNSDLEKWSKVWKRITLDDNDGNKTECWLFGGINHLNIFSSNIVNNNIDNYVNIMYFFHGNAETTLSSLSYIWDYVNETLEDYLWVLFEYPGYGNYYNRQKITDEKIIYKLIKQMVNKVDNFCAVRNVKIKSNNIFGRSIGTGPAIWLSTQILTSKLILIHPFSSILEVVTGINNTKSIYNSILEPLNLFDNFKKINNTKSKQILIIHAKDDPLINYNHSKKLFKIVKENNKIFNYSNITLWLLPSGEHYVDFLRKFPNTKKIYKFPDVKIYKNYDYENMDVGQLYKWGNETIVSVYNDLLNFILNENFQ